MGFFKIFVIGLLIANLLISAAVIWVLCMVVPTVHDFMKHYIELVNWLKRNERK